VTVTTTPAAAAVVPRESLDLLGREHRGERGPSGFSERLGGTPALGTRFHVADCVSPDVGVGEDRLDALLLLLGQAEALGEAGKVLGAFGLPVLRAQSLGPLPLGGR
jgi:hypothetical protein